jgi:SAM-dependent methyltransferase
VDQSTLRASVGRSFGYQWTKWLSSGFEDARIYGKTAEEEMSEFFQYAGLSPAELQGAVVLDAGCGSGRLTRMLPAYGASAVGLDVHTGLAGVAESCGAAERVTFVQGSILMPPFRKESFDLVWSEGVIHHTGDTQAAFRQLAALVKPGGRMFIWVYWDQELNIYRRTRNFLKRGHSLPMPLLLFTCRALAAGFWSLAMLRGFPASIVGTRKITPAKLHAFRLFDHISPRFNQQHSERELASWFTDCGFTNLKRVADLGIRGDHP